MKTVNGNEGTSKAVPCSFSAKKGVLKYFVKFTEKRHC